MNISKKSWHYRLVDWLGFEVYSNICPYFWQVIFSMALCVIVALFAVCVLFFASAPLWFWLYPDYQFGILLMVMWAAAGFVILAASDVDFYKGNKTLDQKVFSCEETPFCLVIKEWIIAQHDKVCPLIRFID